MTENLKKVHSFSLKNDIIFKKSFGESGVEDILKDFLESILDTKINYLEFNQNSELLGDLEDDKISRVDVCATLDNGTIVDIEMQVDGRKYKEKRGLFYWAKKYISTVRKGEDYSKARKVICIWIIDDIVYPDMEECMLDWQVYDKKKKRERTF